MVITLFGPSPNSVDTRPEPIMLPHYAYQSILTPTTKQCFDMQMRMDQAGCLTYLWTRCMKGHHWADYFWKGNYTVALNVLCSTLYIIIHVRTGLQCYRIMSMLAAAYTSSHLTHVHVHITAAFIINLQEANLKSNLRLFFHFPIWPLASKP